uniref:Taste receptor type 2 n=1 Tax=Catagonus wagneri TaxID=51154 RepID=A0A8C3WSU4_9CETA
MPSAMQTIYMILITGESTMGIWRNGFIRGISLIDIILVSFAISRICLLSVIFSDAFIMILYPDTYDNGDVMGILDILWTLSNHSSIWENEFLSIFYLLKIANISHPLFLWLKLKMNKGILRILLVSFLMLLISNISLESWYDFKVNNKENITWEDKVSEISNSLKQIILNLAALVAFILCLISFLLLLFSLFRHTKQMKLYATVAIKVVIIFLVLFIMYYAVFLVITYSFMIPHGKLVVMFGGLITLIFPASHSFILIMGNSKLRETQESLTWSFLSIIHFSVLFLIL